MRLKELRKLSECPEWLKSKYIEVSDEDVYLDEDGLLIWSYGNWKSGTWEDGIWKGGTWIDGVWIDGVWKDGVWEAGVWKDGIWEGGIWESGEWLGGCKSYGFCKWECLYDPINKIIKIGCMKNTIKGWEEWFDGTEEFETKRSDPQFKLIQNTFETGRFLINSDRKFI